MNTWFTSDTHFGHKNICRGTSSWMKRMTEEGQEPTEKDIEDFHKQTRDFATLEEMNQTMIDNINAKVKEDDILWHLGDWALGGRENIKIFRDAINCKNVHLVLGNHDHHIAKHQELQDLFSSVQHTWGWPALKKTKIGGTRFMMCHFPMLIWDKHMHGTLHLHGHCHGTLENEEFKARKTFDVGIDCHEEFRPFHIDEIKKALEDKIIGVLDHHTKEVQA